MEEQATDKQVAYLVRLAKKTEYIKRYDADITAPYLDWDMERRIGLTKADASMYIDAYRTLIRAFNFKRVLLGKRQIA